MRESLGGKPAGEMKVNVGGNPCSSSVWRHHRPVWMNSERSEYERTCWDPKDGELCLSRMKPEETLVEVRSGSDVQIDRQTWV